MMMNGFSNADMTTHMAERGFCNDDTRFIRGETHVRGNPRRWIAMKAGQNHIRNADGTITVWYDGANKRSAAFVNWVNHQPGDLSYEVWFKHTNGQKAWRPVGPCVFSKPWVINRTVLKRGKPHHVTRARFVIPMELIHNGTIEAPEPYLEGETP